MTTFRRGNIDIVRVKWMDSISLSGWRSVDRTLEFAKNELFECESVGYLIHEDKVKLVLAMSTHFGKDNDPDIVENFSDLLIIPKSAIRKKEVLHAPGGEISPLLKHKKVSKNNS